MKTERVHWIDIARGIGIIFVIYAHMLGSHDYRYLFYSFHIPLFFFLSGTVYNHKKYAKFSVFFKKSIKGLIIPYFIFALICYVLWLTRLNITSIFSFETARQFLSIFYGNSNLGLMAFNNILWFLPALFVTRLLFAMLAKFSLKTRFVLPLLIIFSVFGYLFAVLFPGIKLPFGAETAFSAVAFYGAGFLWNRSANAKEIIFKYKYLLFFLLLVLGLSLATVDFNISGQQIDMRLNHLNNYFLFYIDAFSGIFAWIAFSMILNKNRLLEKIGRNSLILFAWHPVVFTYLSIAVYMLLSPQAINNLKLFIPSLYTIAAIIIIFWADNIFKKIKSSYQSK